MKSFEITIQAYESCNEGVGGGAPWKIKSASPIVVTDAADEASALTVATKYLEQSNDDYIKHVATGVREMATPGFTFDESLQIKYERHIISPSKRITADREFDYVVVTRTKNDHDVIEFKEVFHRMPGIDADEVEVRRSIMERLDPAHQWIAQVHLIKRRAIDLSYLPQEMFDHKIYD